MIGYGEILDLILLPYKKNILSLHLKKKINLNKYGKKYNG